jgi:hypothetical protein
MYSFTLGIFSEPFDRGVYYYLKYIMIKLEDFRSDKYQIDKTKLGCFTGGTYGDTPSGSYTIAPGEAHETTISYSSDTSAATHPEGYLTFHAAGTDHDASPAEMQKDTMSVPVALR